MQDNDFRESHALPTTRPSRRRVLGSGAAAAAGLVLAPRVASAAPSARGALAVEATRQAWAAQVGVLWGRVAWSGRHHYAVPEAMTLHGVGPGPVPAGTVLLVTVDTAVVERLTAGPATDHDETPVRGSVRLSRVGGVVRLEWTLAQPLAAGSSVIVPLEHAARRLDGPLASVHHPVVEVVGAPGALAAQVATGLESVTRRDHVTDGAAADPALP